MRIGLLTTSYPRFKGDSAGHFVKGFADALSVRGHQLEVLAPHPGSSAPPQRARPSEVSWVPYAFPKALQSTFYGAGVPDNLRSPFAWPGLVTLPVAMLVSARRRAANWDAVVGHFALPTGFIAASLGLKRCLSIFHSSDLHVFLRLPNHKRAGRWLAKRSRIGFVSETHRERFQESVKLPPELFSQCVITPMGTRPRELKPRSKNHGRLKVLSLGRLVPIKGVDVLLRAAASVDAKVIIAGAGPEKANLERLARHLGVDATFLGHVEGEEKEGLLAKSDLLVVPSRRMPSGRDEGVPTTLLEAMGAGLPIIATDTGGMGALLRDTGSGVLVPPDDAGALTQALVSLDGEPDALAALSRRAAGSAAKFFWPTLAPDIERLLE